MLRGEVTLPGKGGLGSLSQCCSSGIVSELPEISVETFYLFAPKSLIPSWEAAANLGFPALLTSHLLAGEGGMVQAGQGRLEWHREAEFGGAGAVSPQHSSPGSAHAAVPSCCRWPRSWREI